MYMGNGHLKERVDVISRTLEKASLILEGNRATAMLRNQVQSLGHRQ